MIEALPEGLTPEAVDQIYREESPRDFLLFAEGLYIPGASGDVLFAAVMADFQRETFESLAPSLHAIRDGKMPPKKRFWVERTKKASKDLDVAIAILWLIAFSNRPILIQVSASNGKQARIVEDRCLHLIDCNPWLAEHIEIVQSQIRQKKRPKEIICRIEATGGAGAAHGPTPDLLILNELTHVDRWEVMRAHMNNAAGVPRGVVLIATNAGVKGTTAEVWRNQALRSKKRWSVQIFKGLAPWLSEEDVDEAKTQDPVGSEFRRLWLGQWVSGLGDAVNEDVIDAAFSLDKKPRRDKDGWIYLAGLDLGVSHDHAGFVVVGVNKQLQKIRTYLIKGWAPTVEVDGKKKEVDLISVEESVNQAFRHFRFIWVGYDPAAGGSFMAQRLRQAGVPMVEANFTSPKFQTAVATTFVQVLNEGLLEAYEDRDGRLRRDFGKFSIENKGKNGYKLVAVSDEFGHADVGVAFALLLPKAIKLLGRRIPAIGQDDSLVDQGGKLSTKEVKELPQEFQELFDLEDQSGLLGVDDW